MKYLIIINLLIFLSSCKSKFHQPLQSVIKEYFNESNQLKKTKFVFQKQKRIYNLKHNLEPDTVIFKNFTEIIPDPDIYYNHDYLYSFKADSGTYYNIATFESYGFIILQIKNDSITETKCFEYYEDTIPFTKIKCLGE